VKAKFSDVLVQLVIAVVATVVASLLLRALAPLNVTQIALLAAIFFAAIEAVIILRQRSSNRRSSSEQSAEMKNESKPKPFGETLWRQGWKRVDYAIGVVPYNGVLWMPKVPEAQGHFAERVGVEQPPRCPSCRTGLLEDVGDDPGGYRWHCPQGDFETTSKKSMRDSSIGAELKAQRAWEQYKEARAKNGS